MTNVRLPRAALIAAAAFAMFGLSACGTGDSQVVGPPSADAGPTDTNPDIKTDPDGGKQQGTISFHIETKGGKQLVGNVNLVNLAPEEDKYTGPGPDEKGFQIDVNVQTTNIANGTQVTIKIDGKAAGTGTVQDNGAKISKVTLPCSDSGTPKTISAEVAGVDPANKRFNLSCGDACNAQLVAPTGCLTTDADPGTAGFQASFKVKTSTPSCTHAYIEVLKDTAGAKQDKGQEVALQNGEANIVVTLSGTDTGHIAATAQVKAHVIDKNFTERPAGESKAIDVTITTEKPVIQVATPSEGKLTLGDDADKAKSGLQVELKGSVTTLTVSDKDKIAVDIDGVAVAKTTPDTKGVFSVNLEFKASKTYKVSIRAENSCGLSSVKEITYQVFTDQAILNITEPKGKAVLLANDDDNKSTARVYETQFAVAFSKAAAGSTIGVYCRANQVGSSFGTKPVGTALVTQGAKGVSVNVSLSIDDYGNEMVCVARDDGANQAESPPVAFTVGLPAPCLKLTQPGDGITTNAASLPLTVTANNLEGAVVNAKIAVTTGVTFIDKDLGKVAQNSLSTQLQLVAGKPPVALPDGDYVLTVSAKDKYGNKAKDSTCSDIKRTFKVDATAPTVAIPTPATATLDPLQNPDSDKSEPGYQTAIVVKVGGEPVNDKITVCLKIGSFSVPCQDTQPPNQTVTFNNVTLLPGANAISATATDKIGNTSKKPTTRIVNLVSDAVKVALLSPTGDVAVATPEVTLKVAVTKNGVAVAKATHNVLVNGKPSPNATVTEGPAGTYTAVVKGLGAGPNTLQFVAMPGQIIEGVSQKLTVTYKVTKPTVTISAPNNGALYSKAATECLAGSAACVLKNLSVTTTNAADGSKVEISADCGGKTPLTASGTVTSGKLTLTNKLTMPDNSKCRLVAKVTDEAGQTAVSSPVNVEIDRTAPQIVGVTAPVGNVILADKDLDKNKKGMQTELAVSVRGLPSTKTVSVEVFDDDGKSALKATSKAHGGVADDKVGKVGFGIVTLPDGEKIKLVFKTEDTAGNAASFEKTIGIFADAAEIRINAPVFVADKTCKASKECGPGGVCTSGKCATALSIAANKGFGAITLGIPTGSAARLCTNTAGFKGKGACGKAGYVIAIDGVTVSDNKVSFDASSFADGNYSLAVEAQVSGKWVSSLDSSNPQTRYRAVLIDTVKPTLSAALAPQGNGIPAGCLNQKAQDKSDTTAGGTFTFAVSANESGSVAIYADGIQVGSGDVTAGKASGISVKLPAEGNAKLTAVVTDLVGNEGPSAQIKTGKATEDFTFLINTIPPGAVKFVSPAKGKLIKGDNLDVQVQSTDADTDKQPVVITDAVPNKKYPSQLISKGAATFSNKDFGILSNGQHKLTATVIDSCQNATTIATSPATIVVDTEAPTVTITSPANNKTFGDNDDADKTVGGYQVSVTFGTKGAKTYRLELGNDCDVNFKKCKFYVAQTDTAVTKPGGNEPTVNVTVPFGATTNYSIKVTATDENGNVSVAENVFIVKLSGCLVALTGAPANGVANNQYCASKGKDCASVTFNLKAEYVGPCGAVDAVKLFKGAKETASVKPAANKATFKATFNHGDNVKLEAKLFAAGKETGSSGPSPLVVDLKAPVVNFIAKKIDGFDAPATGATALWGTTHDADAAKNGVQFNVEVKIDDDALKGGKLTKFEAFVNNTGTDLTSNVQLPLVFTGDKTQTVTFKGATLGANGTSIVTVTATDTAENVGSAKFTAITDTTLPGQITFKAFGSGDLNPRRPYAKLSFTAVGDNGTSGKPATSYEVRYSRKDIANATDFANACDASVLPNTSIGTPKSPGAADSVMVEGPDPQAGAAACKFAPLVDNGATKYYFSARAIDAAGNKGPISKSISTDALRLRFMKVTGTFNNDLSIGRWSFARVKAAGDINGDGLTDTVYGGNHKKGSDYVKFCIMYGHDPKAATTYTMNALTGTHHQCLDNKTYMGHNVINGIDVNGDGVQDLVVDYSHTNPREVRVYLGEKGKQITGTPAVRITNLQGQSRGVRFLSSAGNFNGDTNNGNAVEDIAITVKAGGSVAFDRVFIIPGNKNWSTSKPVAIDTNSAAARKSAKMAIIHLTDGQSNSNFGIEHGSVGNVIPDGDGSGQQFDDFAIGVYDNQPQVIIVKGQTLTTEVVFALTNGQTGAGADKQTVRIIRDPGFGSKAMVTAFPVEFDGEKTPDLALLHATPKSQYQVYYLRGKAVAGYLGKQIQVQREGKTADLYELTNKSDKKKIGWASPMWAKPLMPLGNFGDQTGGTFVAIGGPYPGDSGKGGSAFQVRLPIVRPKAATGKELSYHVEDIKFSDPFTPNSTAMGKLRNYPLADFNGDGYPDILIGNLHKTNNYSLIVY